MGWIILGKNSKCKKPSPDLVLLVIILTLFIAGYIMYTEKVKFEIEGSCNTGFIGIDFETEKNEDDELEPKSLKIKNIDGLNCNYKIKGAIPKNKLNELLS